MTPSQDRNVSMQTEKVRKVIWGERGRSCTSQASWPRPCLQPRPTARQFISASTTCVACKTYSKQRSTWNAVTRLPAAATSENFQEAEGAKYSRWECGGAEISDRRVCLAHRIDERPAGVKAGATGADRAASVSEVGEASR